MVKIRKLTHFGQTPKPLSNLEFMNQIHELEIKSHEHYEHSSKPNLIPLHLCQNVHINRLKFIK